MKRIIFTVLILAGLIAGGLWFYTNQKSAITLAPSPSPTASPDTMTASCDNPGLENSLESEGAAGNIFVTVTIKNISEADCQINGNNFLQLGYDPTIKNLTITHPVQPAISIFTLAPGQAIYSQIHYPNGPQCSGAPKFQPFTLTYDSSPTTKLIFLGVNGVTGLSIPICTDSNEKTEIQIWPFSEKPITQ